LKIEAIRRIRHRLGITQLALAKRAGLTEIKLSRLECHRERLRPDLADRLCAALQCFAPGERRRLA
jgi:transcriptional regulator with XRE-family HTH domain